MTPARERLVAVAVTVVLGAVIVLASTQTFAVVRVGGLDGPVVVPGSRASPALAPVGIVLLALALALTIAGRFARVVLGVALVLLGVAVVALVLPSVLDPAASVRSVVGEATGVSGAAPSASTTSGSAWPAVAGAAGLVAALAGMAVLVRSRRWPSGGRRYRPDPAAVPTTDPIDEWDALTRGADPTAGEGEGEGEAQGRAGPRDGGAG